MVVVGIHFLRGLRFEGRYYLLFVINPIPSFPVVSASMVFIPLKWENPELSVGFWPAGSGLSKAT